MQDISGKTDLKQAVSDVCGRINGFVKEEKGLMSCYRTDFNAVLFFTYL